MHTLRIVLIDFTLPTEVASIGSCDKLGKKLKLKLETDATKIALHFNS